MSDNRRTQDIQRDIAATRGELEETVDEIEQRIAPENLRREATSQASELLDDLKQAVLGKVDDFLHGAGGGAEGVATNVTERIKENPVPAALIAVGISWLVMSSNAGRTDGRRQVTATPATARDMMHAPAGSAPPAGTSGLPQSEQAAADSGEDKHERHRAADAVSGWTERTKSAAAGTREAASELADNVKERVHSASEHAKDWSRQTGQLAADKASGLADGFERTLHENPLAVGAAAVAAGAALGLILPRTRQEDALMGETRDQFAQKAEDVAIGAAQKAKAVAEAAAEKVQEAAASEADRHGVNTEDAAGKAGQAAKDGADTVRDASSKAIDKTREGARKAGDSARRITETAADAIREETKKQD